jgi:mono/diheme cytochrome c family protein
MQARTLTALVAAATFGIAAASVLAKDAPKQGWSFGKTQFEARCATCHGKDGKGKGPAAQEIGLKAPDLTTFAKRNGGAFPTDLAWQKIDGRPASYDVNRQMPVWGSDFRHEALTNVNRTATPESYVTAEIYALVEYLKSIQVK